MANPENLKRSQEEIERMLQEIKDREEAEKDDYIPREIDHSRQDESCED
ncbi:MAG: hypothetical protein Q7R73_01505 [bacterium]|nr:hypothetical protein [bacterium]